MIRILKEGHLETVSCENCGCVFQYDDQEDVRIDGSDPCNIMIGSCGYERTFIECPQCKKEITLTKITRN